MLTRDINWNNIILGIGWSIICLGLLSSLELHAQWAPQPGATDSSHYFEDALQTHLVLLHLSETDIGESITIAHALENFSNRGIPHRQMRVLSYQLDQLKLDSVWSESGVQVQAFTTKTELITKINLIYHRIPPGEQVVTIIAGHGGWSHRSDHSPLGFRIPLFDGADTEIDLSPTPDHPHPEFELGLGFKREARHGYRPGDSSDLFRTLKCSVLARIWRQRIDPRVRHYVLAMPCYSGALHECARHGNQMIMSASTATRAAYGHAELGSIFLSQLLTTMAMSEKKNLHDALIKGFRFARMVNQQDSSHVIIPGLLAYDCPPSLPCVGSTMTDSFSAKALFDPPLQAIWGDNFYHNPSQGFYSPELRVAPVFIPGDLDDDFKVDGGDLAKVRNWIYGKRIPRITAQTAHRYDVNQDGKVDQKDIREWRRTSTPVKAGEQSTLPRLFRRLPPGDREGNDSVADVAQEMIVFSISRPGIGGKDQSISLGELSGRRVVVSGALPKRTLRLNDKDPSYYEYRADFEKNWSVKEFKALSQLLWSMQACLNSEDLKKNRDRVYCRSSSVNYFKSSLNKWMVRSRSNENSGRVLSADVKGIFLPIGIRALECSESEGIDLDRSLKCWIRLEDI